MEVRSSSGRALEGRAGDGGWASQAQPRSHGREERQPLPHQVLHGEAEGRRQAPEAEPTAVTPAGLHEGFLMPRMARTAIPSGSRARAQAMVPPTMQTRVIAAQSAKIAMPV